jgi:hypothetical protein
MTDQLTLPPPDGANVVVAAPMPPPMIAQAPEADQIVNVLTIPNTIVKQPLPPTINVQAPIPSLAIYIPVKGPQGNPGIPGTGAQIIGEIPSGTIDGINSTFSTVNNYRPNTIAVYRNGLREFYVTESGSDGIVFDSAPIPGDELTIDYWIG